MNNYTATPSPNNDAIVGCHGIKGPTRSIVAGETVMPAFAGAYVYLHLVP